MLMPKKVKHRKQMRGRMKGAATRGSAISFGEYGLKCLEPAWITDRQIEAARIAMTRHIKGGGKIWIRMFPDLPDDDLQAEAARLKESLFRLNFKLALGEVDAIKKMRQEKKSLARIRTLVREREIHASK